MRYAMRVRRMMDRVFIVYSPKRLSINPFKESVSFVSTSFTGWLGGYGIVTAIALTLLGTLAIYRHRANIKRLLAGTENRFQRKSKVEKSNV